ncbi:hypothetical protein ACFWSF_28295 [Streptomyces sp. NPDC058611]
MGRASTPSSGIPVDHTAAVFTDEEFDRRRDSAFGAAPARLPKR